MIRSHDAWTTYDRRTEMKEERKRATKQYNSNSSNFVKEVTPQILFLDTKPFVIFTVDLPQVYLMRIPGENVLGTKA